LQFSCHTGTLVAVSDIDEISQAALAFWPDPDEQSEINRAAWDEWVSQVAPRTTRHPMGDHHKEFWNWVWQIDVGVPPSPSAFAAFWPRGHGKSASAELAVAALLARGRRRYCVYVCRTQDKADEHVASIGSLLESPEMQVHYPEMGERLVGKFGQTKGWRRNRMRTATGATVDGLGLDTAARGTKIDDQRPDLIILDDIDNSEDGDRMLRKNERLLTRSILPAGSDDLAVIFAQNLIHQNSLANQLATNRADWLTDRHVSGPHPAVVGLRYESMGLSDDGKIRWLITGGEPTWAGMDLEECERKMNLFGADAFIAESQNDVTQRRGALWSKDLIKQHRVSPGYERGYGRGLVRTVVGVDPSVSDSPYADECGIVVVGKGADGRGYVLDDVSIKAHPADWARRVVAAARKHSAVVVAESNQGGALVRQTIQKVDPFLGVQLVHARKNKQLRAQPIATLYQEGFVSHVGAFSDLEQQMTTWLPEDDDSPDRLDALVYALAAVFPATGIIHKRNLVDRRGRR
jgi:predicted phage terminase large subunit-like protein